jgi:hypothetical protein
MADSERMELMRGQDCCVFVLVCELLGSSGTDGRKQYFEF